MSVEERVVEEICGELRTIDGRLKTFVESITEDSTQSKARKDITSQLVWGTTDYLCKRVRAIIKGTLGEEA